ncbi:SRPBCC family protein [Streptomyces mayteni]
MFGIRRSTTLAATLAFAGLLGLAAAPAQAAHHRDAPGTCRGEGVDPDAAIRYEADTLIDAPLATIWEFQTDVANWPSWQAPVLTSERLDSGRLRAGSQFRWTTPAPATPTTPETTLEITSTVEQLRRGSCLLWSGPAVGEGLSIDEGVHLWTFTEVEGGVLVHTEETWTGEQVEADVDLATEYLGRGLEAWLTYLEAAAEGARACGD